MADEQVNPTPGTEGAEADANTRIARLEETVLSLIDLVKDLSDKVTSVEKTAVKKPAGLFGGKREKTAIKDKTTNKVYPSKAAVGKALYKEIDGGDPADHFIWYKLLSKFPDRWQELTKEDPEAQKVWKDEADAKAKEVEESNKRLAAEEAAKEAAAAAGTPATPAGAAKAQPQAQNKGKGK